MTQFCTRYQVYNGVTFNYEEGWSYTVPTVAFTNPTQPVIPSQTAVLDVIPCMPNLVNTSPPALIAAGTNTYTLNFTIASGVLKSNYAAGVFAAPYEGLFSVTAALALSITAAIALNGSLSLNVQIQPAGTTTYTTVGTSTVNVTLGLLSTQVYPISVSGTYAMNMGDSMRVQIVQNNISVLSSATVQPGDQFNIVRISQF